MSKSIISSLTFICLLLTVVSSLEWYENSKNVHLTWENFDRLVSQPGQYKFVNFFTRACRYCRMLKQVQEQLRSEKNWSFQFYDVDCTQNYDLCSKKATISGYPYVGIYNGEGLLQSQIGGFYPLQAMRGAFNEIQNSNAELKSKLTLNVQQKVIPTIQQIPQEKRKQAFTNKDIPIAMTLEVTKDIKHEQKLVATTKEQTTTEKVPISTQKSSSTGTTLDKTSSPVQQQGFFSFTKGSVQTGLKLSVLLFGFWMFNKVIAPYLQVKAEQTDEQYSSEYNKSRKIQIPLNKNTYNAQHCYEQTKKLLSDTL